MDFNGDGVLDIVTVGAGYSPVTTSGLLAAGPSAAVLLGNGDGTFQPAQNIATSEANLSSFAVGEFNGDGKPDLALLNLYGNHVPSRA